MKLPLPLRQLYPRCRWLRHLGGQRSTVYKRECVPDHLRALAHIEMYVIKGEPSALDREQRQVGVRSRLEGAEFRSQAEYLGRPQCCRLDYFAKRHPQI